MEERKYVAAVVARVLGEKLAAYETDLDWYKYRTETLEAEVSRLNAENQNLANVIARMTEPTEAEHADD